MVFISVHCPGCRGLNVVKHGKLPKGEQRYRCGNSDCDITTFLHDWGAYSRHIDPAQHTIGKRNTQKIERKHLTLRTRIKRLVRKTICFSKSIQMHDIVIGLFINRFEFGLES